MAIVKNVSLNSLNYWIIRNHIVNLDLFVNVKVHHRHRHRQYRQLHHQLEVSITLSKRLYNSLINNQFSFYLPLIKSTGYQQISPKLLCVVCKDPFTNPWDLMVHAQEAHMINIYELGNENETTTSPTTTSTPENSYTVNGTSHKDMIVTNGIQDVNGMDTNMDNDLKDDNSSLQDSPYKDVSSNLFHFQMIYLNNFQCGLKWRGSFSLFFSILFSIEKYILHLTTSHPFD